MLTLEQIKIAHEALKGVIHRTNMPLSRTFSNKLGSQIYLKMENQQKTGAFKIRGAFYKVSRLSEADKKKGIVAVSAGNHSQGVALAAQHFGIPASIVMPECAALAKIIATESYGAKVILKGKSIEEAMAVGKELAAQGMTFIHPFDDNDVIAGQGTIGIEMLQDVPDLDAIVVPIGGGGLISGIATAAKAINPNIKIIGVEAEDYNAVKLSVEKGENLCIYSNEYTIADGIAVGKCGNNTYEIISNLVDEILVVSDDEVSTAIFWLVERAKNVVEGAGAVGIAALLANKIHMPNKKIAVVLSGGNIDLSILQSIIDRGLVREGRRIAFNLLMKDKPGQLKGVTDILSSMSANIYSIQHDRVKDGIRHGYVNVSFVLQTKDNLHTERIFEKLRFEGFEVISHS